MAEDEASRGSKGGGSSCRSSHGGLGGSGIGGASRMVDDYPDSPPIKLASPSMSNRRFDQLSEDEESVHDKARAKKKFFYNGRGFFSFFNFSKAQQTDGAPVVLFYFSSFPPA